MNLDKLAKDAGVERSKLESGLVAGMCFIGMFILIIIAAICQ